MSKYDVLIRYCFGAVSLFSFIGYDNDRRDTYLMAFGGVHYLTSPVPQWIGLTEFGVLP